MAEDSWDAKAITVSRGRGFGPWYSIMRWIGRRCTTHFFSSVDVIGELDSVPAEGPFILVCTHFSTIMDVAVISAHLPHNRPIHYWAKKGLYRGKTIAWILNDSGNIQVDRKTKSNQDLFQGTFDAMQAGEAIGLFPEGGSYTEPKLHSMKAGAAWAALEYAKYLAFDEQGHLREDAKETKTGVKIVPASINYTEKSRFRSKAVFQIGRAFSVDEYSAEFLSASSKAGEEVNLVTSDNSSFPYSAPMTPRPTTPVNGSGPAGDDSGYLSAASMTTAVSTSSEAPPALRTAINGIGTTAHGATRRGDRGAKGAVQKLTDRIGTELNAITINAPDWKTWHAMKVARELFWAGKRKGGSDLDVKLLVPLSNALITLFADDDSPMPLKQIIHAQEALVRLQTLQLAARTDLPTLNCVAPLVSRTNYAVPSLPRIASNLALNVVLLGLKSPLYGPLFAFYFPAYLAGWYISSKHAKHEEESMASVKSLIGFPVAFLMHALLFLLISSLFLFTPPGLILACIVSISIRCLEERVVLDDGYHHVKLICAYGRLLLIRSRAVQSFRGDELEIQVMSRAVEDAQPVQYTLTKAFAARRGRKPSGASAADIVEAEAEPVARSPTTGKRLRRPAPIRLLQLAMQSRRECVVALKEMVKAIKEEGSQRQRDAWRYLEANGAKLV